MCTMLKWVDSLTVGEIQSSKEVGGRAVEDATSIVGWCINSVEPDFDFGGQLGV